MNNVIKVMISLCVVLMVMGLSVSCGYSQDKPSEDVIKSIICKLLVPNYRDRQAFGWDITHYTYNSFQMTHYFFQKTYDGRVRYCVEITYELYYTRYYPPPHESSQVFNVKGQVEKFSFMKKGDNWYGNKGWDIQ